MLIPTVIMAALAVVLLAVGYFRGGGQHRQGLKAAGEMTLQILPLLIAAFVVAGMAQVLVPKEALEHWIGAGSGLRGIFLGTLAGGVCPGGPYVSLPIVAGLYHAGAGTATLVAFLTSWSLWAVARLPMEVAMLGWRFTAVRLACVFLFPPIAGLIAHIFFRKVAI
jgi:uncharacterized membrane protein YraQ (UPF0718 family)